MSVPDAGEPVIAFAVSEHLPPVSGAPIMPPTISVGTRIARVVQRADRGRWASGRKIIVAILRIREGKRDLRLSTPHENHIKGRYDDYLFGDTLGASRASLATDRYDLTAAR